MKYRNTLPLTCTAAAVMAALAASSAATAQEVVTSDTVKVTASRVEQELQDVNMSVSVITAADIARSNARTVGELLKDVPGVQINNDGGQGIKRVGLRGENAFRTLVMIDGQKMAEHKSMSGSPLMIDPSQIERIEVIKGPASVLYGSDALGGAINIITKKGGTDGFNADVSVGMDTSSSGRQAAVSLSGQKDGWHYRLGAAYEKGEDLNTPAGDMEGTDFQSKAANLFLAYDINENNQVGFTLDHFDNEFNSISITTPGFYVHVPTWKRTKAGIFSESKNLNDYLVRLRLDAFYQKSEKDMTNFVPQQGAMPMSLMPIANNEMDQYGFSAQADWQLGENHYLITGYEFEYDKLDATSTTIYNMLMGRPYTYDKVTPYNGNAQTHALFAAMEATYGDFILNYGARYTYVKSEMDANQTVKTYRTYAAGMTMGPVTTPSHNAGESSIDSSNAADNRHDDKVVFNAGVVYKGIENTTLRALWAQGFRTPILQELYVPTSMGSTGTTFNNPNLKPETSDNFEIGARYLGHGLMLDASVFLNLIDDYIATLPEGSNSRYANVAKAKSFGLELAGSLRLGDFEPYVTLTAMRRQYDNGQGYKTYNTATPNLWARYGVRWNRDVDGLNVHTDFYAHSQTASKYSEASGKNDYRLGGATTLNLTGGVAFGPQKQYQMDLGFYNIGDKKYQDATSIYEPGRYFAVKLNAHY